MESKKKALLIEYLITGIIALVIGLIPFFVFFFSEGKGLIGACDGTGFSAIILLCAAGLIFVSREGFFDIFSYGFKQLGTMIFAKHANANNDFPGYKQEKNALRKTKSNYYLIIALVGALYLIAFIILRVVTNYYL